MSAELRVRVTPRASRDEIAGERDGTLLVRVTAPPEGGKANKAVCKVIAKALRVAPSRVSVVRGAGSREKLLRIEDLDPAAGDHIRKAALRQDRPHQPGGIA
jgi:uncharacterized protein (TIGR00251 family)